MVDFEAEYIFMIRQLENELTLLKEYIDECNTRSEQYLNENQIEAYRYWGGQYYASKHTYNRLKQIVEMHNKNLEG